MITEARSDRWLLEQSAFNVTSQCGEDGIIKACLQLIGEEANGWCVEFGAHDGEHFSNTFRLSQECGYQSILIEADDQRFDALAKRFRDQSNVHPIRRCVGFGEDNNLDRILAITAAPADFDVLSIDIDGNDYHVWKATTQYRPKVVCVEYNPTMPTDLDYCQPADDKIQHGSSIAALCRLGREKGYELVAVTDLNCIFVREEYFERFRIGDNSAARLRPSVTPVPYVFFTYDGRCLVRGNRRSPWHKLSLSESRMQPVPRALRAYPARYNFLQRSLFRWYVKCFGKK